MMLAAGRLPVVISIKLETFNKRNLLPFALLFLFDADVIANEKNTIDSFLFVFWLFYIFFFQFNDHISMETIVYM